MAIPYRSTMKYLDYKEDVNMNAHVKVFQVAIRMNGKTFEEYIIATLTLGLRSRQGVARLWAKRKTQESHHMLPRVQRV